MTLSAIAAVQIWRLTYHTANVEIWLAEYRISVQIWEHIIQLLYKSLQACTNSECVQQIEESPDSESCEAQCSPRRYVLKIHFFH